MTSVVAMAHDAFTLICSPKGAVDLHIVDYHSMSVWMLTTYGCKIETVQVQTGSKKIATLECLAGPGVDPHLLDFASMKTYLDSTYSLRLDDVIVKTWQNQTRP